MNARPARSCPAWRCPMATSCSASRWRVGRPPEALLAHAVDHHLAGEHLEGPHPQRAFAIQRSVNHQGLVRFAVSGHAEHLVVAPFVMGVQAGGDVGQRGQVVVGAHGGLYVALLGRLSTGPVRAALNTSRTRALTTQPRKKDTTMKIRLLTAALITAVSASAFAQAPATPAPPATPAAPAASAAAGAPQAGHEVRNQTLDHRGECRAK